MSEPVTDEEKIAWLWNKVDHLMAENRVLKEENAAFSEQIGELSASVIQLSKDIAIMGVELNAARTAARESVLDYMATQEG